MDRRANDDCTPRRGDRGEQRDNIGLTVAASLFQHAANLGADRVLRDSLGRGDGLERWHQTRKNRILLENYYLPSDLETQTKAFVADYNHWRYPKIGGGPEALASPDQGTRAADKCATLAIQGRGASTLPQSNFWAGNMLDREKASRALFNFAVATLALVAVARAQADPTSPPSGAPQPVEIKIVSTEFKFAPAKLLVAAGRAVTIVFDNSGAETEHGVSVPALGFRLDAKAGEIARKTAVFDKPGEYEFSCDLPGHREAGMRGKLIVTRP